MNKTWRFHPDVATEVEDASRWYEKQRVDETVRRIFLPRFKHVLVFVERHDEYFVVGIPHLRRRPGYWLERLDE